MANYIKPKPGAQQVNQFTSSNPRAAAMFRSPLSGAVTGGAMLTGMNPAAQANAAYTPSLPWAGNVSSSPNIASSDDFTKQLAAVNSAWKTGINQSGQDSQPIYMQQQQYGQPTIHDIGMGIGGALMGQQLGAYMGFGNQMQNAMNQIGSVNAANQQASLMNKAYQLEYQKSRDKLAALSQLFGAGGTAVSPGGVTANLPLPSGEAPTLSTQTIPAPAMPTQLASTSQTAGLQNQWNDLNRQNAASTTTGLGLATLPMQASLDMSYPNALQQALISGGQYANRNLSQDYQDRLSNTALALSLLGYA